MTDDRTLSDEQLEELRRLEHKERNYQEARQRLAKKAPPPTREEAVNQARVLIAEAFGLAGTGFEADDKRLVDLAFRKLMAVEKLLRPFKPMTLLQPDPVVSDLRELCRRESVSWGKTLTYWDAPGRLAAEEHVRAAAIELGYDPPPLERTIKVPFEP